MEEIIDKYINSLSYAIDNSPKFDLFRTSDPDFDKEVVLINARRVAIENYNESRKPNISPKQLLDIMKFIKKSNEINKLIEKNHCHITHINDDGTLHYVYTKTGYKYLKSLNLI